ncbi:MAG: Sec-independent protein translocase protein TatB [Sneathiella sp.]
MFDIGWSEMVFVAIIAIIVIGPKDLPHTVAAIAKYIRKARGYAREFQTGIDDLARDAELDDLKKSVQKTVKGDTFNIKKQIEDAVGSTDDFSSMFEDAKPDIVDDKPATSDNNNKAVTPPENAIGGPSESADEPAPEPKVSS